MSSKSLGRVPGYVLGVAAFLYRTRATNMLIRKLMSCATVAETQARVTGVVLDARAEQCFEVVQNRITSGE